MANTPVDTVGLELVIRLDCDYSGKAMSKREDGY
jgi:hypothetical protein